MQQLQASVLEMLRAVRKWRAEVGEANIKEQIKADWVIVCFRLDIFMLLVFLIVNVSLTMWFLLW